MDYERWCAFSDDERRQRDIAENNLNAALGLPGAENLDIGAHLAKLDEWALLVEYGIHRMWKKCGRGEYREFTPNQFRILVMVTVLQRNLGVRYNPACIAGDYDARDPRNNFIHGPLSGHGGTCASLPILYLAIGRRLGFPLFLAQAKDHLFVRWDEAGERFNIEATSLGFEPYDDLHYRFRPRRLTDHDLRCWPHYLRNLTPREELACCLAERAAVFFDNLQLGKAVKAIYFANQITPYYTGRWAVLSMTLATAKRMHKFDPKLPWEQLVQVAAPQPRTQNEHWAIETAKKELVRHIAIRRDSRPEMQDSFFTSLDKEPPHV